MSIKRDDSIRTRPSLLKRLKNWDDQESWRHFYNTYWKLIYGTAIKAGLTHDEAEDVIQETVITVTKNIKGFNYDPAVGSFRGWLLNTTRWKIADVLRGRQRPDHPQDRRRTTTRDTATIDRIPDPNLPDLDAIWESEWREKVHEAAMDRVKQQVSPKQFQIYDLYVTKQWPVRKVVETMGVSEGQVYLAKNRILERIKQEVRTIESGRLSSSVVSTASRSGSHG